MASIEIHKLQSTNDVIEWCTTLNYIAHLVAYVATLAVLGIVLLLIVRLLGLVEEDTSDEDNDIEPVETNPLISPEKNVLEASYGTLCEDDLEKGSNGKSVSDSSSCEDLYDGRLCVICYDEPRDCFFVPCGHCATCCVCADRIFYGENKTCPVCRRLIGKVRRLYLAT